ncbi:MAG: HD domain-containing protein [Lachnospiraceae bacterium]|nr:HD domain-containing protein [Lachnospiraceae bacterium]MBP5275928.1 HD domain-containing protein [Lachnospiraceae bacterium]
MKNERLEKQIDFILEIDKEKNILRQTHLTDHGRRENDAEHAWHMAVMAYLLKEYSNADIDITKVMIMCLIHDVVEIDAGDTYCYDEEAKKSQAAREEAAKQRIFALLPEDQRAELTALFEEFEANETAEAHFAHTMDNFQPLLLNNSNDGMDWASHGVSAEQVYGRQGLSKMGSDILYEKTDEIIKHQKEVGHLK